MAIAGLALCRPGHAAPITVTTIGTINSGDDPGDILGAGPGLIGSTYTLIVSFSGLGSVYRTDSSGGLALDVDDAIPGSVTVTIGGYSFSAPQVSDLDSALIEDRFSLFAQNSGTDTSGNTVATIQHLNVLAPLLANADLHVSFSHILGANDVGVDAFSFSNATGTQIANFAGTQSSITLAIPEPKTWLIIAFASVGLAILRRAPRSNAVAGAQQT